LEYQTGIVFSGGGARGFAHAGALKALEEFQIFPQIISGVSAGAIAGVLYADGFSPDEMMEIFLHLDLYKLLKFKGFKLGLLNPDGLKQNLQKVLRANDFSELKKKLIVGCTNLELAQTDYFSSGKLLDPVIASAAFPFLIRPQVVNGVKYVDGGLMNNLPVQPLLGKCQTIIGVHVNPVVSKSGMLGPRSYFDRIIHMGLRANMLTNIEKCDLFIEPPELSSYHLLKVSSAKEIFEKGYQYTFKLLANHPDLSTFKTR